MKKSSFSSQMQPEHLRATRMLGYALVLHDFDAWTAASDVWSVRLTAAEIASIAVASLAALDPDTRAMVITYVEGAA